MELPRHVRHLRRQRLFANAVTLLIIAAVGLIFAAPHSNAALPSDVVAVHYYPFQPDDWTPIGKRADIVVIGVIKEVGPSRWATPNGEPASLDQLHTDPNFQVRTPVTVTVEREFKGDPSGSEFMFSFAGGQMENVTLLTNELEDFTPGRRVILFLGHVPAGSPARIVESDLYPQAWLIVNGNTAVGPLREVPLATVVEQLENLES